MESVEATIRYVIPIDYKLLTPKRETICTEKGPNNTIILTEGHVQWWVTVVIFGKSFGFNLGEERPNIDERPARLILEFNLDAKPE